MTKKFDKYYLTDTLCLPWDQEYVVEDEIVGHGRWDIYHRLVFKDLDGKYWETEYWEGATEMQPEGPWEYENEVECIQVEERVMPVTKFLPVDDRETEPEEDLAETIYCLKNFAAYHAKGDLPHSQRTLTALYHAISYLSNEMEKIVKEEKE